MSTPVKPTVAVPDYDGGSLINLMAELEARLTGTSASPQLHDHLASSIPEAATYVVVLFDGLGNDQLSDPDAAELLAARTAVIDAPFPTTTTVSLASVATGLPPSQHGLLGYQLWIPQTGHVVNTIKWTTLWGDAIDLDTGGFLPSPNLWERVAGAGCEPITAQPIHFETSGLSSVLYRGCRFEGITSLDDMVDATLSLASVPRRLVFAYVPNIDFAAHVFGQDSAGYRDAMRAAATAWERLAQGLPADAVLIGTADHGHVDFPEHKRIHIAKPEHEDRTFYGDGRAMFVRGEGPSLAAKLGAMWVPFEEMRHWWGPEPLHPAFSERAPDGVLVPADDEVLLHRFSDRRLIGAHGGLTVPEGKVPVLVASR